MKNDALLEEPTPATGKPGAPSRVNLEEASRLFLTGEWTLEALGDRYGVTRERIRQIFYANGIDNRRTIVTGIIDAQWPEIVAYYEQPGVVMAAVCDRYNLMPEEITRRMRAEGRTKVGPEPVFDYAEIARLFKAGLTTVAIGRKLGTTQTNVHRVLVTHYPELMAQKVARRSAAIPEVFRAKNPSLRARVDHQAVVVAIRSGRYSHTELAREIGISATSIHAILKRHAPELLGTKRTRRKPAKSADRPRAPEVSANYSQVRAALEAGETPSSVAARFNLTTPAVIRYARSQGVNA